MIKNDSFYQSQGLVYSSILHLAVLALVVFGLPEVWRKHRESLPVVMSVEVLPVGETNIKPKAAKKPPAKKPKPKKPKPKAKPKPKPLPKIEPLPVPKPKKEKPKKKPVEKPKPKPEKKKPKPKPKKVEPDLADILRSVEEAARNEAPDPSPRQYKDSRKPNNSTNYNSALPLAMSEVDAIRQQLIQCWNVPAGAKNAHNLTVVLELHVQRDGSVTSAELAEGKSRYYSDGFFRAAVDSAIRAVHQCSPLNNLPIHKYDTWKNFEISFDPQDMLY